MATAAAAAAAPPATPPNSMSCCRPSCPAASTCASATCAALACRGSCDASAVMPTRPSHRPLLASDSVRLVSDWAGGCAVTALGRRAVCVTAAVEGAAGSAAAVGAEESSSCSAWLSRLWGSPGGAEGAGWVSLMGVSDSARICMVTAAALFLNVTRQGALSGRAGVPGLNGFLAAAAAAAGLVVAGSGTSRGCWEIKTRLTGIT